MKAVTFSFPLRKPIGGMCDVAAIGVVNSICGFREVLLVRRFMIGVSAIYTTMRPVVMDAWSVPSVRNYSLSSLNCRNPIGRRFV